MEINISGYLVLVDDSDVDKIIKAGSWHVKKNEKEGLHYFYHSLTGPNKNKYISLHRFIIGAKKGEVVDHINQNTLDNRRQNLRIVDYSASNFNRTYKHIKYPGTCFNKNNSIRPYSARITINGKRVRLGSFKTQEEASVAYRKAKAKYCQV